MAAPRQYAAELHEQDVRLTVDTRERGASCGKAVLSLSP